VAALDYITLAEWKTITGWQTGDTRVDAEVPTLITEASNALNEWLERQITPSETSATKRVAVRGCLVDLDPYDARSVSAVVLGPESSTRAR
jgi:hypothetical protein